MDNTEDHKRVLSFTFVVRICLVLGAGSGILLAPFMAIGYRADLGVIEIISLIVVVPFINALVTMLYGVGGFWLYRYLGKHGRFGLDKYW